jgi:hypothetical protein
LTEIKRAQERKTQFKKIRAILKPNYILVPKDFRPDQYPYKPEEITEWEPIQEHKILQVHSKTKHYTFWASAWDPIHSATINETQLDGRKHQGKGNSARIDPSKPPLK